MNLQWETDEVAMSAQQGNYILRSGTVREIGAKAASLAALERANGHTTIPPWFVVSPRAHGDSIDLRSSEELRSAIARLAGDNDPLAVRLAVRSSSVEEDSAEHAFAGQFDSYLGIKPADVADRIADVWRSAMSERVVAYRCEHALPASTTVPAVLVQRMVGAETAGVAFSADPVDGRRGIVVVAATYGLGISVVSGEHDADTYRVDRAGEITGRVIARKHSAVKVCTDGGTSCSTIDDDRATAPALADAQIREIAALARLAESFFGRPQDIEWAIERDTVYLLQSRPITSLHGVPDPDAPLCIWDNSNITESYGGVTTPLTYSFARYVYEEVYRQFCRVLGVTQSEVDGNSDAFRSMIGLVRGRMYYNLVSWYSTLALLPGFRVNQKFMEQMMGVKESLPTEITTRIASGGRSRAHDMTRLVRSAFGLFRAHLALTATSRAFHRRLGEALDQRVELHSMRPDELIAHYRQLEQKLLRHWDAPLVNDFFAMIYFGLLGKICMAWCADTTGAMQGALVSGEGDMVSVEPVRRMREMAAVAAHDPVLAAALCNSDAADALVAIRQNPELRALLDDYIGLFGDRCIGELKLETETYSERPDVLLRSVGRMATTIAESGASTNVSTGSKHDTEDRPTDSGVRATAEAHCRSRLDGHPLRRVIFGYVLTRARSRVRDRENLRFDRTRVFGRVRRIFAELGKRFAADGLLDNSRDIFYLEVDEIFGVVDGITSTRDLRGMVALRRREFDGYAAAPAPPDRFGSRGDIRVMAPPSAALPTTGEDVRRGTGCYPGVVRGPVRVVRDPTVATLLPGEILVAERTDPGWVVLFPCASAILVERGSLLSHSAIVARELGIPAIVAVEGLTSWLRTGDTVELDGATGIVTRIETIDAE